VPVSVLAYLLNFLNKIHLNFYTIKIIPTIIKDKLFFVTVNTI